MRLIDADELKRSFPAPEYWTNPSEALIHVTGIWAEIDNAPTISAQQERKTGKWEAIPGQRVYNDFRCSQCHRFKFHNGEMRYKYKFCPNCGADMREPEE